MKTKTEQQNSKQDPLSSNLNMEIVHMIGDGNCLFRAIAHQVNAILFLTFDHHMIRRDLAKYVEANQDKPNIALALAGSMPITTNQGNENEQRKKYINQQYKDGAWGGEDIIIAAAEYYYINVTVHQAGLNAPITYRPREQQHAVATINLLYHNNHYDSLLSAPNSQDSATECTPHNTLNTSTTSSPAEQPDATGYTILRPPPCHRNITEINSIKIATWNVRGTATHSKKNNIDKALKDKGIHIACLQETNLSTGSFNSKHYTWHLSGSTKRRGLALLARKDKTIITQITRRNTNIMAAVITAPYKGQIVNLYIIIAHIPSLKPTKSFSDLINCIDAKPKGSNMIILGDFNAHVGKQDINTSGNQTTNKIGPNLFHTVSDNNGEILLDIIKRENLRLDTSRGRSSCKITWQSGNRKSQIDHILTAADEPNIFNYIKGEWRKNISDHKIILADIIILNLKRAEKNPPLHMPKSNEKPIIKSELEFNYRNYDYSRLQSEEIIKEYQKEIKNQTQVINQQNKKNSQLVPWDSLMDIMKSAAAKILISRPIRSREHRIALAKLQKAKFIKNCYPREAFAIKQLSEARHNLQSVRNKEEEKECETFFRNLSGTHPSQRMKITYDFYRRHKISMKRNKKQRFIPMSKWEEDLKKSAGPHIELLPNENPSDVKEELSEEEISDIIKSMSNGKAPGTDKVVPELFKALPTEMLSEIIKHLQAAWISNNIPMSWNQTIQIPVPKKAKPDGINDYRKLSMCNVGYRIYANFLLRKLDAFIKELGNYQAAFLRNRSTDDHMYTLRRILDEEWRAGSKTYVLALDIEKAYDTLDLNSLRDILVTRTNKYLTNRIIKACMNEFTYIKWYGQQTESTHKGKGVKQGCPLSPRLFTIAMDDVLRTLEEEIECLHLDQDHEIKLPIILSFADDVIIATNNLSELDEIVTKIKPLLESVGLHINETKTKLVIRDPHSTETRSLIRIGGTSIQPVDEIKYLGTYITSTLNRNNTVNARCKQAMRNSKAVISFIKNSKMEWKIARLIYKMVIEPAMTYGLKAAALTKANRSKLRRYERLILKDMIKSTRNPPNKKTREILMGKTITKKIKCLRLCYYGHILRRPDPHLLHAAIRYKAKRLKVGRPIYTWNESLQQDMEYFKKSKEEWIQLAADRKKFKSATQEIYHLSETDSETNTTDDETYTRT